MRRLMLALASPVAIAFLAGCEDVTDPDPGTPVDISFAECQGSVDAPSWFAFQDGEGSWTRVTPSASGAFDFTLTQGKGGIATWTEDDGLFIVYASTEEFQANVPACTGAVRTVTGDVVGYAFLDNVHLQMGGASGLVFGSQSPPAPFVLSGVDAGATDLIGVRYRTSAGSAEYEAYPDNIFIRRGVSGSTTPRVDFNSNTEAGAPVKRNVSVTNIVAGEAVSLLANIGTPTTLANISVYEGTAAFNSGAVVAPFYGVPASRLTAGESQMLIISANRTVSSSSSETRFGTLVFTDATDKTITLGPSLVAPTVTGSSRPTASYSIQSGYDNLWDVVFEQGSGNSYRFVEVLMTKAYLGSATAANLAVPNLSGVSGFSSTWLLVPGSAASWTFLATDADVSILNSRTITYKAAQRSGVFTP